MLDRKALVISLAFVSLSNVSAGIVTKCESDDSKCKLESTRAAIPKVDAGIPEFNLKSLDPLILKRVDASTPSLKLILSDLTVTGTNNCIRNQVNRDDAKKKLFIMILCSWQIEGQYEMDGQLLTLPINGKGPVHATLRKVEISIDADLGDIQENSITYWDVKDWKHTFTLKDKSDIIFDNLFDGNEVLAEAARSTISESGNEIIVEVGPPLVKAVVAEVVSNINAFFHKVSVEELSMD